MKSMHTLFQAILPVITAACISIFCTQAANPKKSRIVMDFEPVCDTLDSLIRCRTSVKGELELNAVMKRGKFLDFYFTRSLGDWPWTEADARWFRSELKALFPEEYRDRQPGSIYSNRVNLDRLTMPDVGYNGKPQTGRLTKAGHRPCSSPLVKDIRKPSFRNGLENMHIALWHSHGRYYEQSMERWEWQRPCLFQTAEDIFTQGFVLPYLVPMLENAGAYVLLPRERDTGCHEIIVDNDPSFERTGEENPRTGGVYSESGVWTDAGTGFADTARIYYGTENPFTAGTARMAACTQFEKKGKSVAVWRPEINEKGEYAVYVSYRTLPDSSPAARYTVRHLGGESTFMVNQTMGGGTWIYLGTFMFDKGNEGCVMLDNISPVKGKTVTADAVKCGGGMGNIARRPAADSTAEATVSGLPRFVEGARYWMQWAGADTSVYSQNGEANDYMDDFMSRGAWVGWLSGGSDVNPDAEGKGIPVDLSFGLHSDAGTTPNDSTVGTLAIYTLRSEKGQRLPDGEDRMTCREYAHIVQSQTVRDIRAQYDTIWNRRSLWDRSYSESRTPPVPAMLLELLSHQNFADMRYGLDPAFRFTASRAIYKGILKYLANRYGRQYAVQPLPVNSFAAVFSAKPVKDSRYAGKTAIELSWKATADTLEPTAAPDGFILYTRIDSADFDNGVPLKKTVADRTGTFRHTVYIDPGHIYSFKITAVNSGGESFPSEILSAGLPQDMCSQGEGPEPCAPVLIVNNFYRVSAPVSFDTPRYAGFDNRIDSGVPYIKDFSFSGEMYQYRREMPWTDDDNPGFGASDSDYAGKVIAGNTFDYPYLHGISILRAGHPFCSASADAFQTDTLIRDRFRHADLICGKQVTTKTGNGSYPDRYRIFTSGMQDAVRDFCSNGGNILVSGAYIGTDIWDRVYETECDSTFRAESIKFAENVLGYRWITGFGSKEGKVKASGDFTAAPEEGALEFSYNTDYSSSCYRVENPDGIAPATPSGKTILKYTDSGISAGICNDTGRYRTVIIGFPFETIAEKEAADKIISSTLKFFEQ